MKKPVAKRRRFNWRYPVIALLLVGAALVFPRASNAIVRLKRSEIITLDPGGSLIEYANKYADWRRRRVKITIDGMCISACAMITGLIDDHRVCVTPRGKLAFHSAMEGHRHSLEGTRLYWQLLGEKARGLLRARGWDGGEGEAHPNLIYVDGSELYAGCK